MKKNGQKERLLKYLKTHRTITNYEGVIKLAIMCTWKRIADLRADGVPIGQHPVRQKNQFGEFYNCTKFYLTTKKPEVAPKGICR